MSLKSALNTVGRLGSLAEKSGAQQNAQAKGQEKSEPAKLFGALLEKPEGKAGKGVEKDGDAKAGDTETGDGEAVKPVISYGLPQNILVFDTPLPQSEGVNHSFATGFEGKIDPKAAETHFAIIAATDPEQFEDDGSEEKVTVTEHKPAPHPKTAVKADNVIPESAGGSQASGRESDEIRNPVKPDRRAAPSQPAAAPQQAATPDRIDVQPPLTAARNSSTAELKTTGLTPPQATVRIADVEIVSERSFGTVKTLQIRLDPAELGTVTARIRVASDGVEVHLVADKTHAAEALIADRSMIEKALRTVAISDDAKISVTVADRNAPTTVQNMQAPQNGGQNMGQQQGFDGRNGSGAQAQFTDGSWSGEGRQNGESGQAGGERPQMRGARESGSDVSGNAGRRHGLVV